jgi:hypothetical protein
MARFRGTLKGNRGEASRLGTGDSELVGRVSGWDIGCEARIYPCRGRGPTTENDDTIMVKATHGSNGQHQNELGLLWLTRPDVTKPQFEIKLADSPEMRYAAIRLLGMVACLQPVVGNDPE